MNDFFKKILNESNDYSGHELQKCNEWQNEQVNRAIEEINNALSGHHKVSCIAALIERLSYIIVSMDMDIDKQLKYCNEMIVHYVNQHQKMVKKD